MKESGCEMEMMGLQSDAAPAAGRRSTPNPLPAGRWSGDCQESILLAKLETWVGFSTCSDSASSFLLPSAVFAAAAKLLQSRPTLCDPVDGSPPGSPIPGILQARILKWAAISFSTLLSLGTIISPLNLPSQLSPCLWSPASPFPRVELADHAVAPAGVLYGSLLASFLPRMCIELWIWVDAAL